MALLTGDIQGKLVSLLISEGLVSENVLDDAKIASTKSNTPLLCLLT